MFARSSAKLVLASAISTFALSAAGAVEGEDVGARFKALMEGQGVVVSWTAIDSSGADVVMRGVTAKDSSSPEPIKLGDISFDGIEESANGDYVVETLAMPKYETVSEGATVTMEGLSIAGAVLPSPTSTDIVSESGFFDSLDVDSVTVVKDGKQLFNMTGLNYEIEKGDGGKSFSFTGSADAFTADLTASGDPQTIGMANALGLAKPKGTFEMAGDWSLADGDFSLEQMDFTIENAGTLGISFDISGYTAEFLKAMRDMQKGMINATEEQKQAAGMAVMGLMQQLTFAGATIRYDDDALAGRALDFAADMQKMKRSDMAPMAQMVLPMVMGQYVTPEFAAMVSAEVAKFVTDPKSFEIKAEPAAPVPFMMVGMSAMTAPQGIPAQLGVTVTANEEAAE